MKRSILLVFALCATFFLGYAFKAYTSQLKGESPELKRVTGIGGIFFKCKEPKKVRQWYQEHLGLNTNQYGSVFEWYQGADSTKKGFTQWSPFSETTKYFAPSTRDFMINFRVADLPALIEQLRNENVQIADSMQTYNYGKFVHIIDVEGNKVELWEPNDVEYESMGLKMGIKTTK